MTLSVVADFVILSSERGYVLINQLYVCRCILTPGVSEASGCHQSTNSAVTSRVANFLSCVSQGEEDIMSTDAFSHLQSPSAHLLISPRGMGAHPRWGSSQHVLHASKRNIDALMHTPPL